MPCRARGLNPEKKSLDVGVWCLVFAASGILEPCSVILTKCFTQMHAGTHYPCLFPKGKRLSSRGLGAYFFSSVFAAPPARLLVLTNRV